jgi:WD40 repeat protein
MSVLCLQFEEWRGLDVSDEKDGGGVLVSGSSDSDVVVWNLETGKKRWVLKVNSGMERKSRLTCFTESFRERAGS